MKQNFNFVNTFYGDSMKKLKKLIFFLTSLLICISLVYLICYLIPAPKINKSNEIAVYDKNDELITIFRYDIEDKYLKINEINEDFLICFLVSEDQEFYNHNGFSIKGIIRALINNIKTNSTQGGSTISQQLARSLFLDNEKSIIRKIKEAFITISLETHYEKVEIIEQYLNNIYLGHNIYGIESASRYYFNKSNTELTLDEVAMIVGIANAPNINAPDINYENSIKRRNVVLNLLNKAKYIDDLKLYKLINTKTEINITNNNLINPITPIYYYIKNYLKSYNLTGKTILSRGLKVYTTIDYSIQEKLINTINNISPNDSSSISCVILKVNSGDVLAMCGSYDISDQYNRALYSSRPISSTIKPLLYYLALKLGFSPDTYLSCNQMTFNIEGFEPYTPTNASNKYSKNKINMIDAIALSDNIYATKTLLYVGFNRFEELMKQFNISGDCVPSSCLGVNETTLMNLSLIYNTFASLGNYYTHRIIRSISDNYGTIFQVNKTTSKKILSKKYVYLINQMLRAPFDKNLTNYTSPTLVNYKTNHIFAAKTGTDESNSYTIGFNPLYTIGVWCGNDDNTKLMYKNISKKVFQTLANSINEKNVWYTPPSYIKEINKDKIDNYSTSYWTFK